MTTIRVALVACALVAATGPSALAAAPDEASARAAAGAHGFDFLFGDWTVRHRRVQADTHEWVEFDGTCRVRPLLDGSANLEEQTLDAPNGTYRAVGLRAYDAKSDQWSIRWLDGRYPSYPLDPPVRGRFENGVGAFYSDYVADGTPTRVRYLWSHITPTSARWEQATSTDSGATWDTNWVMEFRRAPAGSRRAAEEPAGATAPRDFDFEVGDWRVAHRYLRAATKEWVPVDGTCDAGPLMGGWANLEEHVIGAYRAVGLRAYDPKTAEWSIWWLDGRDPAGALDPPVRGKFENGVGTFYGDLTLDGKPARVRFVWSRVTPTTARWEQAYSTDAGKTWETNWTMDFRRRER